MGFTYKDTQIVKGMLARGDRQHDIASYFGVNGGRVAEVATDQGDFPNATALSEDKLPPCGPYVGAKTVFEIKQHLQEAIDLIEGAGTKNDESQFALDALKESIEKLS